LHDWRAHREVVQPAGDLVRKGVTLEGLPEWVDVEAVMSWIEGDSDPEAHTGGFDEDRGLLGSLGEWWAEGASYGGALLIALVEDGRDQSEPLDRASMVSLVGWEIVDRWCCWPHRSHGQAGPVEWWIINDQIGRIERASQIVHPSRVYVHTGRWMPRRWREWTNQGWGPSWLELLVSERLNLHDGMAALGRLLKRTSTDVVIMPELSEMVGTWGRDFMVQRAKVMAETIDSDGILMLDGGIQAMAAGGHAGRDSDDFKTVARPMSGGNDVAELQHSDWRRGASMPAVVADGDAAAGLNGGVEAGPWRAWSAQMEALWAKDMAGAFDWALGIIFGLREGPTQGRVPESWTTTWNPIAEPDHKLEAEIDEIETRTDAEAQERGQLKPEEIRQWRAVDGKRGRVRVESASLVEEPTEQELAAEAAALAEADAREDRYEPPKAGVMVEIPDQVARLFPWSDNRPHVTLLYIGPTEYGDVDKIREVVAQAFAGRLPVTARLGELGYFDQPAQRVAWVGVEFEPDIADLHEPLREALMAAGVMVQHPGREWIPHATLGTVPLGEEWTGPTPPAGTEWLVERVEVWHGE
jgi:2'-5' RNA ligase